MLFEKLGFVILPNINASSTQFRCKLIEENGGTIVHSMDDVNNNQIVVLIVDSFLNSQKDGINDMVLFVKESSFDLNVLFNKIDEFHLFFFKCSQVGRWLSKHIVPINDIQQRLHFTKEMIEVYNEDERSNFNEQVYLNLDRKQNQENNGNCNIDEQLSVDKSITIGSVPGNQDEENDKKDVEKTPRKETQNNSEIIKALEYLAERHKIEGNHFKSSNYSVAKKVIEKCNFKIVSGKQAERQLPHIGPRIGNLIQRIVTTGSLPGEEIEISHQQILTYFQNCHGVGPSMAKRWALLRMNSFKDVLIKLSQDFITEWPLLYGWKYYEEWSMQILRRETAIHFNKIKECLSKIDERCHVEIQGSYNRGMESSGDIDLLFYREDCDDIKIIVSVLQELIIQLHREGYIKCILQLSTQLYDEFKNDFNEIFKKVDLKLPKKCHMVSHKFSRIYYLGVILQRSEFELTIRERETILQKSSSSKLKDVDLFMSGSDRTGTTNYCRRLDFFSCRWSELGAARLQWTGSAEFNRWIRLEAIKKGYKLTQHGLFYRGKMIESFDEERIFKLLDIPYIDYEKRERGLWERKTKRKDI
ncbi:DNA-directed DNA polymerase IV PWA37_001963 [Arxiozyma heterogenica]|uniref:DNA-directed DNA polymerase IV n=1 Tax=Arxiozyma heterogenica TaxID=278026 RepID=UPI002EDE34B4